MKMKLYTFIENDTNHSVPVKIRASTNIIAWNKLRKYFNKDDDEKWSLRTVKQMYRILNKVAE